MKKLIALILLCLAGCGTMSSLNSNMSELNVTLETNIETLKESGEKIAENTSEVSRSTNQLEDFKKIIHGNTETINGGIDGAKQHTTLFPLIFIGFIALLFLPTVICLIFYYMFFQKMRKR